jgi:hypothetical protein
MIEYYLLAISGFLNLVLAAALYFSKRKIRFLERNILVETDSEIGDRTTSGGDLFLNLTQSKALAKTLKVKIHPDRFIDEEKKSAAQELYKQVAANSSNYKELQRISGEIDNLVNNSKAE